MSLMLTSLETQSCPDLNRLYISSIGQTVEGRNKLESLVLKKYLNNRSYFP